MTHPVATAVFAVIASLVVLGIFIVLQVPVGCRGGVPVPAANLDASQDGMRRGSSSDERSNEGGDHDVVTVEGRSESGLGSHGDVRSRVVPLGITDTAANVLRSYQDEGGCVLVDADYLDLLGNTWSCTVQGAGWVDLCLVHSEGDDVSKVTTMRMDAKDWEDDHGWGAR